MKTDIIWTCNQCDQIIPRAELESDPRGYCQACRQEMDARLAAAAPDMLDALKKAERRFLDLEEHYEILRGATLEAIQAAIAKAEGRK